MALMFLCAIIWWCRNHKWYQLASCAETIVPFVWYEFMCIEGNPMRSTSRKPMAALCDDLSFTVLPHDILSKKKGKTHKGISWVLHGPTENNRAMVLKRFRSLNDLTSFFEIGWSYITICSDALTYSSQVKLWNKHLGLGIIFQDKHTHIYIHTYVHICIVHIWKYICYFTKQIHEIVCTLVNLFPKGRSCITSNDIAGSGGPVWQTLAQQRPRSSCTKAQLRLRWDWL